MKQAALICAHMKRSEMEQGIRGQQYDELQHFPSNKRGEMVKYLSFELTRHKYTPWVEFV